jgi:hypothetical protein
MSRPLPIFEPAKLWQALPGRLAWLLRLLQFEQLRRNIQDGLASGEAEAWNPKAIKAEGRRRLGAQADSRLGL